MKIRSGFVSNSSSSSFICNVCGHDESGMDLCLSDAEMSECENGHVFCDDHTSGEFAIAEKREFIINYEYSEDEDKEFAKTSSDKKFNEWWDDNDIEEEYEFRYNTPASMCPMCSFKTISDEMLVKLVLYKDKKTREDLEKEFKGTFTSYENYKKLTKNKKS